MFSSCSCLSSAAIFSSRLCSPWAAAVDAALLASTCAFAACRHLPTASSMLGSSRGRAMPWRAPAAACLLLSGGLDLAAATASNCMRRSVFGTSLPLSTSVGSKSGLTPRTPPTLSAICWKRASRSSRASGQSLSTLGGKPVAAFTARVTSRMNFGGGLANSSEADFFIFPPQRPSHRMSCPSSASVLSGLSETSVGRYSCNGFAGMPAGRAPSVGSARMAFNVAQCVAASSAAGPPFCMQKLVDWSTTSQVGPISMEQSCSSSLVFSCNCCCRSDSMRLTSSSAERLAFSALPSALAPSTLFASSASWFSFSWKPSTSVIACRMASESSEADARLVPSICCIFSPPFRSLSSFGKQRLNPKDVVFMSLASAPSPTSLTSSSKACLKTSTMVRCSFSSSTSWRRVRSVFSHWRGCSPMSSGGGDSNLGRCVMKSTRPRIDNSRSFFSCRSRRRLERSSSSACAALRCSSATFCIIRSCSSLSFALSVQLFESICSISLSCRSNFAFSCSLSCSVRPTGPPPEPAPASFFFSSSTSAFSREICEASSFFVAATLMDLARFA
mmetsp:Transcript_79833/g.237835  ORF Transcript_79833/g.237835 Transcript_79833/m.237835 type:complete len:560 (+) Transcript_79833:900-2579(+)